ncbi:uncharacterized protein BDW47DRAFT_116481 [Aspergillus candidus]|uniref:NADH-cytochrome b5 reductase 1 n=1 Tax=Aspergillus candidus TaxID=41067 RepID=A0A2I2FGF0_ASPCN|nr:hypothetical protein BDW47DRAFT_116481 [Aspergillus candidus]PLB39703.1 hypothetical protein BDW47DRAFT_116481 [Aspergillus candidus]
MGVETELTWADIKRHRTPLDLWVTIDGKVYDVTEYQQDHPGGEEILRNFSGQDATAAFADAGHSHDAYEKLESLLIGRLEQSNVAKQRQQQRTATVGPISVVPSKQKQPDSPALPVKMGIVAGAGGALLILAASYAAVQGYFAEGLALLRPTLVPGSIPANAGRGYLNGILTAIACQGVAGTLLGLHLNTALFHRHRQLEDYPRARKPSMPITSRRGSVSLHRDQTTMLTLESRQCIGGSGKESSNPVYRIRLKFPDATARLNFSVGQHIRISAEIDGRLVHRSYTPVSSEHERGMVDLVVKVYPRGRMGNYLQGLPLQSSVAVRGLFGDYRPNPAWTTIGCITGGTGITPIYQVLREWCHKTRGERAVVLYGSERQEDILLREELDALVGRYPERVQVHHVLSQPPPGWTGLTGRVTGEMMEELLPRPVSHAGFFICGPDGMVRAIRGHLEAIQGTREDKAGVFVF